MNRRYAIGCNLGKIGNVLTQEIEIVVATSIVDALNFVTEKRKGQSFTFDFIYSEPAEDK